MNKTYTALVFGALVALGLVGYIVLAGLGRDTAGFGNTLFTLLGLAATALGLGAGLTKIERQTNGTLTTLRDENTDLRERLAAAEATIAATTGVVPPAPEVEPAAAPDAPRPPSPQGP